MRPDEILILPAFENGASIRLRSGLRDLQDRVSTLSRTGKNGPCGRSCTLTGRVLSAVSLLLDYAGMARRLGAAPSKVGFGVRPAQSWRATCLRNWSGQRDLHSYPGVGNAELYCLSYDRKAKKNKHLQTNSGRRIIPLAVFQDFRSPASSKNKKPRSNICEQGETEIYFSISSLPTRLSFSLDWVSVRSCRNNYTNRLIFPNDRLSLSR